MAREIDLSKKLSKEDVEWLSSRYPDSYVERQIELAGGVKGGKSSGNDSSSTPETAPPPPETPEDESNGDSAADGENGSENGSSDADDLIGETPAAYDPSEHNADDVIKHLATVSDEEKSRILTAEAAGKARSTVLNA